MSVIQNSQYTNQITIMLVFGSTVSSYMFMYNYILSRTEDIIEIVV